METFQFKHTLIRYKIIITINNNTFQEYKNITILYNIIVNLNLYCEYIKQKIIKQEKYLKLSFVQNIFTDSYNLGIVSYRINQDNIKQ